jgi:hypothetical protein
MSNMESSNADKENISSISSGRQSRLPVTSLVLGILSFLFLAGTFAANRQPIFSE